MKVNVKSFKKKLMDKFGSPQDLKMKEFVIAGKEGVIFYFSELTDARRINDEIMMPLLNTTEANEESFINGSLLSIEFKTTTKIQEVIHDLLTGNCVIAIESFSNYINCNVEKITGRAIEESPTSIVIKGPREGFVEDIKTNLALVRKRLRDDSLKIDMLEVGTITKTSVAIIYLGGIASNDIVKKIKKRINDIKIDGIVDSSYIEGFLKQKRYSLFKQVGNTEKPDVFSAKILEGRVGILVDGSPFALTLPFILLEDLQDSGDYYDQPFKASFLRVLRLVGVILAVMLPGIYVALQLYHYKILPTEFLITIMNTTKDIPFTPFIETFFIVILFEILYEANLRMPQYVGMALSIVGALILGETAVNAGLVSPPAVMIVALSGISFYLIPNQTVQFTFLRLLFTIVGACLGLYGIIVSVVLLVAYLCNFDNYSSQYMAPLGPYIEGDQKDFIFKKSILGMKKRPLSVKNNRKNLKREENYD